MHVKVKGFYFCSISIHNNAHKNRIKNEIFKFSLGPQKCVTKSLKVEINEFLCYEVLLLRSRL